jgi:PAS domain S-box-containing protein
MEKKHDSPNSKLTLLQAAEKDRQRLETHLLQTSGDLKGVFRELQTYLAELEFQNDELRRAFDERSKSHQLLQELFERAPVGYCLLSRIGIVLDANATMCRFLGLDRSRVLDRSFGRFIHPEYQTRFIGHLQALWNDTTASTELRIATDRKTSRPVLMESMRQREYPDRVYTVVVDMSQRRRGSDRPLSDEEKFRLLFSEMIGAAAVLDVYVDEVGMPVDAVVLDVNPAFEQMTDISRDRAIGKRVLQVMPSIERHCFEALSEVLLTGKATPFEIFHRQKEKHFRLKAFGLKQGRVVVVTGTDVTESKTGGRDKNDSGMRAEAGSDRLEDCVVDLAKHIEKNCPPKKERPQTDDQVGAQEQQIRRSDAGGTVDGRRDNRRPSPLLGKGLQENLISIRMRLGIIQDRVPGADSEYEMEKIDALLDESIQMARLLNETASPPVARHAAGKQL